MINLLQNILWLNIKKLKVHLFWRVLFVILNYSLFFAATMLTLKNMDSGALSADPLYFYYIFAIIGVANSVILYVKTSSEVPVVALYRSLGASKSFIVLNTSVEMLILFLMSVVLFFITAIFRQVDWVYFWFSLLQIAIITLSALIYSILAINRAENIQKAR